MSTVSPAGLPLSLRREEPRLAALLFLPLQEPLGALLICHGAGSRKENHAIMAEQAVKRGLAAMVFDFRGHGESEGRMDADAGDDVLVAAEALRERSGAPWLAARGSSLGAFWLVHAASARPHLFRSLVLLCPADEASLLRGLDHFVALDSAAEEEADFAGRFSVDGLREFWASSDLFAAARGMRNIMVAHATDDEDVPFSVGERLAAGLEPPRRLIALPEGGHKGPQRSSLVAKATLDWVLERGRSERSR